MQCKTRIDEGAGNGDHFACPVPEGPDDLVINVYGDGRVFLAENGVTLQQLEQELLKARENYADQGVIIRGEGIGPS